METKEEKFVEMRLRTIDEAMSVDKLIGHLTFDQVMEDDEKMDVMMVDGQNFKMLLEEVDEPHRMVMGLINPDEADLLYMAAHEPETTVDSLAYQMVKTLKELGITVEKAVAWDKQDMAYLTKLYLRKADGTEMIMEPRLYDALVVTLIARVPFYLNAKFLEDRRPEFTKSVPKTKSLLLRMMTMKGLEREMKEAISQEDYEYAELVKLEMQSRKKEKGNEKE